MTFSTFLNILFPPPPSLFITTMSVITCVSLANAGINEVRGKHLNYSKFWNVNNNNGEKKKKKKKKMMTLSSKSGMFLLYTPAFVAGAASFLVFPDDGFRSLVLQGAVTVHFFKRVFEVLFVHKYSGSMALETAIPITLSYFLSSATMIYTQHLTSNLPEPPIDLLYPGIALFLVGVTGNFYHHYLFDFVICPHYLFEIIGFYKIPKGGLFDFVICPHYLFEIIGFYGFSFISQTLYSFSFAIGTTFYLLGRSYATREWYLSKFDDFPKNVKAIIPFLF